MKDALSRREFLKLAAAMSGSLVAPRLLHARPISPGAPGKRQNVLIVVFDTLSAHHLSLLGYSRDTSPLLSQLADRAIVYHNHYAAGPWTIPSTASLFTGVLPWSHRAFSLDQRIEPSFNEKNLFHAFGDYHRFVYSHNPLVYTFFDQYASDLDETIPIQKLFLTFDVIPATLFKRDDDQARVSWRRIFKHTINGGYSYSLFLSRLYEAMQTGRTAQYEASFPRGLPNLENDNYFLLEQAIDFLADQASRAPTPFLGYFHFWPPHHPYKTSREFFDLYVGDPFQPMKKPRHAFAGEPKQSRYNMLVEMQRRYDEVIRYVDREFERLMRMLEASGRLEDTWVILTSDHGELFERGILGHGQPVVFDGVIRVPLIIFEPGRSKRLDVHLPTSAVDLLPTLLQITGGQSAPWTEGAVLPPFRGAMSTPERSIFAVNARENSPHRPLSVATTMLAKGRYKLIHYFGYDKLNGKELVELYDLEADPDELANLVEQQPKVASALMEELRAVVQVADQPYS